MAFNGSGIFNRLYNWVADRDAAIPIDATKMDAEMDGIATGLSNTVTKDGQTTITANLPMATFRHTGVGNGAAATDYAAVGQIQDGSLIWLGSVSGSNIITASASPAITAYAAGQMFVFEPFQQNTGATTIDINGLGPKAIRTHNAQALPPYFLQTQPTIIVYDGSNFNIVNGVSFFGSDMAGASTVTLNVTAGVDYEFFIYGDPSADGNVYLRVSDDGTNYNDTSGDNNTTTIASDGAGSSVSANTTTDTGHLLTYYGMEGGGTQRFEARGLIQGRSGSQSVISSASSYTRSVGRNLTTCHVHTHVAFHSDDIARIRVVLTAGTWTWGVIGARPVYRPEEA
jgi:hypothetical protein